MAVYSPFKEGEIESIARALGEAGSGTDISRVLAHQGITDDSEESTKWRRLYKIFLRLQKETLSANQVLAFIRAYLTPARFVGKKGLFEEHRQNLNTALAFAGLEYGDDGEFHSRVQVRTLTEAENRVRTIKAKFQGRVLHPEVLKYCKAELMQENYFHAVFEASKGLAQRLREMSGVDGDGTVLVDKIFLPPDKALLACSSLQTETEKSEHKGFAALLKGCFGAVRNPLAHEPKILWSGEDDAADYLSLISLLHRRLDGCVKTRVI